MLKFIRFPLKNIFKSCFKTPDQAGEQGAGR
jgi:hypothetical protein